MAGLNVPIVVAVTGEGGSGGALALGVGDRVLIFEYAVYSVISPEGCAAILWKDQEMKAQAAEAMRITAPDLLKLGVVDEIVAEPPGGVHTDPEAGAARLADAIERALAGLERMSPEARLEARYRRFRALGVVGEIGSAGDFGRGVGAAPTPAAPAAPRR
jgi:acetyl-CoA carboxylase carboxyl transferase subunit alpha